MNKLTSKGTTNLTTYFLFSGHIFHNKVIYNMSIELNFILYSCQLYTLYYFHVFVLSSVRVVGTVENCNLQEMNLKGTPVKVCAQPDETDETIRTTVTTTKKSSAAEIVLSTTILFFSALF